MKKSKRATAPARHEFSVFRQICNFIPNHLVPKLARETGANRFCRTFSAWSHCVALLFAQFTHALGLNDVCDSLRLHSGLLSGIRGATPPSRNNLSHANKVRPAELGEQLFWAVLGICADSPLPLAEARAAWPIASSRPSTSSIPPPSS